MRKVKYLVAALLLMGATTTFTSCIDNDEPAGITDLRGAKAELIRAKAAVETARVAYVEAQTRWANAKAEGEEISNKMEELKYLKDQAQNEFDIAKIQAELEIYQVKWEQLLYQNKINLEETKKQYNDLMASLEAAGEVLNEKEEAILKEAKIDLQEAYDYQQQRYDEYEKAQITLNNAYQGFDADSKKKDVEREIEYLKFELQLKQNWAAYLQNMLNKDFGVADWEKEAAALKDSVDALVLQKGAIAEDSAKFKNSEEYRLAEKAVADTEKAYEEAELAEDFKYEIPAEIADNFEALLTKNGYQKYVKEEGTKKFFFVGKGELVSSTDAANPATVQDFEAILECIEDKLKGYGNEWDANLDDIVTNGESDLKDLNDQYKKDVEAWKAALAKYDTAKDYDINTAYQTAEKVVKDNWNAAANGSASTQTLAAQNAIAAGLVAYYNAVNTNLGLTTSKKVLYVTQPDNTQKNVENTVLTWLSDATYSGVYLDMLAKDYLGGWSNQEAFIKAFLPTSGKTVFVESIKTVDDIKDALIKASYTAFGSWTAYYDLNEDMTPEAGQEWLIAEPSKEDIENVYEADKNAILSSTAGKIVDLEVKIAAAEDQQKYKEEYTAVQTALTTQLTAMQEQVAELKEAWEEADAKFEEYKATVEDYEDRIEAIDDTIDAVEQLIKDLKALVSGSLPENSESTAAFVEAYTKKLDTAKAAIIDWEEKIAAKEEVLVQLENGTYTSQMNIEQCKQAVEFAKAVCAEADKLYEDALARLQAVVEALTKGDTASAE